MYKPCRLCAGNTSRNVKQIVIKLNTQLVNMFQIWLKSCEVKDTFTWRPTHFPASVSIKTYKSKRSQGKYCRDMPNSPLTSTTLYFKRDAATKKMNNITWKRQNFEGILTFPYLLIAL